MWAKCNVPILAILLSGPIKMMIVALMMSLELIASVRSVYTDVYNFPMLGTLQFDTVIPHKDYPIAYGTVTIVHKRMALCAAENLLQIDPGGKIWIYEDADSYALKVFAGSDLQQPPVRYGYEDAKVQSARIKSVYTARNFSFLRAIDRQTNWDELKKIYGHLVVNRMNREDPRRKEFIYNAFRELQWDVGILVFEGSGFEWTPYVLPIPFHWQDNRKLTEQYVEFWDKIGAVEKQPQKFVPCSVPGWSPIGNNEIIYHKVVYVRFKDCAEAICGKYPSTCLNYLNVRQHICFKSLGFADSCVLDQGAPVVCSWTPKADPEVLGILVKTFDCGTEGLPLVFTRMYAIAAFAKIGVDDDENLDANEPNLSDPRYIEKPV